MYSLYLLKACDSCHKRWSCFCLTTLVKYFPLMKGLKRIVLSDKIGVDLLCGLYHIVDINIMPIKSCVEVLGYSQHTSRDNNYIPMPTSLPSVPTFISSFMTTSTQNNTTHVIHGGNPINQYSCIPSLSLPFVSQPYPIPAYHNVPPLYSQPLPSYKNVTPLS